MSGKPTTSSWTAPWRSSSSPRICPRTIAHASASSARRAPPPPSPATRTSSRSTTSASTTASTFMVMELLKGGTVADKLRAGDRISPRTAMRWLRDAASALDAAHAADVVHRDVKPANMLLDDAGRLAIADFGIARLALEDQLTATGHGARHRGLHLARAGGRRPGDGGLGPLRAGGRGLRAADRRSARSRPRTSPHRRAPTSRTTPSPPPSATPTCRPRSTPCSPAGSRRTPERATPAPASSSTTSTTPSPLRTPRPPRHRRPRAAPS